MVEFWKIIHAINKVLLSEKLLDLYEISKAYTIGKIYNIQKDYDMEVEIAEDVDNEDNDQSLILFEISDLLGSVAPTNDNSVF